MSSASVSYEAPLLTYSLLLPSLSADASAPVNQSEQAGAGRLYFLAAEAQEPYDAPQLALPRVVGAIRNVIARTEGRECALHRMRLVPSASREVAEGQTVLYAERAHLASATEPSAERNEGGAILTSCQQVYEAPMLPHQCFKAATTAPLCIFQDLCGRNVADGAFWLFLREMLQHGTQERTRDAAVTSVRGRVLSAYEGVDSEAFCVDVFAAADADKPSGERPGRIRTVDSSAAVDDVILRLQNTLRQVEECHGSSLLVVEVTWGMRRPLLPQSPPRSAPSSLQKTDQKTCIVWLRNAPDGDSKDGVYAEAALEMLLDELTLAAAGTRSPQEATAVLEEPGVKWFFDSCCLTRELGGLLRTHFLELCKGEQPLFHWLVCAPPSFTSHLGSSVTRHTFAASADGAVADFWCVMEELEHWREVVAAAAASSSNAAPLVPTYEPATRKSSDRTRALLSFSASLRENARVARERRTIRQSGHQVLSASLNGSVLWRQRCKLNVPKLYGFGESVRLRGSPGAPSLESSLMCSGVYRHTTRSPSNFISGTSLLDAEEAMGHTARLAARPVKRIPQSTSKTPSGD
ncbi:hypothetical protein ABB37_01992 [Leptomonas pyrrhocoris]|uniref:Uncharacterized protein n=1 Tax=Leptomonas pyrrhocoris TaxID=157538 RepID=A0A0M9G777_LEPPY|nr:hypothetical protein ABB37_01992 [Leptomonas pyrrhocoris]XP_015662199.1 hypothetical protein ABB37_01992 [Leptomonas pyrrhocoris]KPA83759.1 hypothetical protein ABB37_01992 [Leptomonas pyrrhocoris]KPA83760.1 hypothetical protein ABB37_01992 [Leptomonas pyrrhocoris]|eukprot:XP_015662198.1 hypothetical protein ABB37_01992 [Leptomonas pyrrhocoris]